MKYTAAIMVGVNSVYPPHAVRDTAKRDRIRLAMEQDGWTGRPLLVMDCGGYYKALTGSHRLDAAMRAGINKIPVVVTAEMACIGDYGEMLLCEMREEGHSAEACALLEEEISHDYEDGSAYIL